MPTPETKTAGSEAEGVERLQKVLAHAGVGSRRACEDVILQGRVTVDGRVVRELGSKVDPRRAKIAVDGQAIHPERMVYFAVSKPKGYVSTNNDPSGRPRVVDLLPEIPQRVYTVGRLDEMSTGLILLTNDGELANRLAHPRFGVEKLYRVVVAGLPDREVLEKLTQGVWLAEGKVRARRVRVVGKRGQATVLEMVLAEGKNREVRRMLAKLGHKVMALTRVAVGPITLKGLGPGEYRPLSAAEIDLLRRVAAGLPAARSGPRAGARKGTRASAPSPGRPGPSRSRQGSRPPYEGGGPPRRKGGAASSSPGPGARRSAGKFKPKGGAARRPAPPVAGGPAPTGPRPGPGARVPRPEGLPPSQRRVQGPSSPGRPAAGHGAAGEPPTRRIIGLDAGPAPRRPRPAPIKRRPPRAALGRRRPGPRTEADE